MRSRPAAATSGRRRPSASATRSRLARGARRGRRCGGDGGVGFGELSMSFCLSQLTNWVLCGEALWPLTLAGYNLLRSTQEIGRLVSIPPVGRPVPVIIEINEFEAGRLRQALHEMENEIRSGAPRLVEARTIRLALSFQSGRGPALPRTLSTATGPSEPAAPRTSLLLRPVLPPGLDQRAKTLGIAPEHRAAIREGRSSLKQSAVLIVRVATWALE